MNKVLARARQMSFFDSIETKMLALINKRGRCANVAMFHSGRCGSTVLGDILNTSSSFCWASELFEDTAVYPTCYPWLKGKRDRARRCVERSMYSQRIKYYGFETKFLPEQHLSAECANMTLEDYVHMLLDLGFTHYIILYRKNHLRRVVSVEVGRATNTWHSNLEVIKPTRINIDINNCKIGNDNKTLLNLFRSIDYNYSKLEEYLSNTKLLKLVYEDDIMIDPRTAYKKIADFIGMDYDDNVDVRLNRTNPFALSDMIINFDEVVSYLKGTEYQWMLEL